MEFPKELVDVSFNGSKIIISVKKEYYCRAVLLADASKIYADIRDGYYDITQYEQAKYNIPLSRYILGGIPVQINNCTVGKDGQYLYGFSIDIHEKVKKDL